MEMRGRQLVTISSLMLGLLLLNPAWARMHPNDERLEEVNFQPKATITYTDSRPLTLQDAINIALQNYPAIRAAYYKMQARHAEIDVAKTAYLPDIITFYQVDRSTHNKLPGAVVPGPGFIAVMGPAQGDADAGTTFQTLNSVFMNWNLYDFGARHAQVNAAAAAQDVAASQFKLTQLDVASQAATAFLKVIASQELVKTAQANVDRSKVLLQYVSTLVHSGLKPGADQSRAEAELAAANTKLIQARQQEEISQYQLGQAIGYAGQKVNVVSEPFSKPLDLPPLASVDSTDVLQEHPMVVMEKSQIHLLEKEQEATAKSMMPTINLMTGVNGRGSGLTIDGKVRRESQGLLTSRFDGIIGVQMTYHPLDYFRVRAKEKVEQMNEASERANYDAIMQKLVGDYTEAKAVVLSAMAVAKNTPIQLNAAQATELQVRSRYKAGLASIVDVADAQRVLTEAEIQDALAKLGVWSAMLGVAESRGTLQPFLELAQQTQGGSH